MDTYAQILADARKSREEAFELLRQLDEGTLVLAKGTSEANAREILRLNIQGYDKTIASLGGGS